MRAPPTFGGIALVVIGLLMINFGAYTYTVEVPKTETRLVFEKTKLTPIGDFAVKEIELQEGWVVNLDGKVGIPDSSSKGEIDLYVMNENEYQKWKVGEKNVNYVVRRERIEEFNETFVSTENGTFYILLDNRPDPKYKKEVTLSARYTFETKVPETREERILTQAGYPLVALGAVSLIYGLVRKPVVRWE